MLRPTIIVLFAVLASAVHAEGNNDRRDSGIGSLGGIDPSRVSDTNRNGVKDLDTDGNGFFDHVWSALEHAWDTVSGYFSEYHSSPPPARSDYDCYCVRGDLYIPNPTDTTPRA